MRKRTGAVLAVVALIAAQAAMAVSSPAAADHGDVHCMWGKAYEANMLYRVNDTVPA